MKEWGFKYISLYFFRQIELNKLRQCVGGYTLLDPILDVGCGDGVFTKEVFGEGRDIMGIDNSTVELEKNKESGTYTKLRLEDACNMRCGDGVFNTVFSNCVIEHIPHLYTLLNEVNRVLKVGGYFVFTVPSDKFKEYLLFSDVSKWYGNARNKRLHHYHCHNVEWWYSTLEKNGLQINMYEYYLPKPALMWWDFLALSTFHFSFLTFPFSSFLYTQVEKGIEKYSKEVTHKGQGAAIAIIAKKI